MGYSISNGTSNMIRWMIGILITLCILIIISVAILFTPAGLKITLSVAKKFVPGELHYEKISGSPIGPLTVANLTYRYKKTSIYIKKIHFKWRPGRLFQGKLDISKLKATGVRIVLPSKSNSTSFTLKDFKLPLELHIGKAIIHNIKIGRSKNHFPVHIETVKLKAELTTNKLYINAHGALKSPYLLKAHLLANGTLKNYHLQLKLKSHDIDWAITGSGGQQSIQLSTHEAHTLGGSLDADVIFHWLPHWQWKVNINMKHLNLRKFYKNWPKDLTLNLVSEGHKPSKQVIFSLSSQLRTPGAHIQISGNHNRQWNLHWKIAAKQLSTLFANYTGSLQGEGTIKGNTIKPIWSGQLNGKTIRLPGYRINSFNSQWNVDLSYNQTSHIIFKSTQLETKYIHLAKLDADVTGRPKAHIMKAYITMSDANAGTTHITAFLKGGLINRIWHGRLNRLDIQSKLLGRWHLVKPAQLQVSSQQITTTPICIRTTKGRSCLEGEWHANKAWQVTLAANGINITPFVSLFKLDIHLLAPVNLNAKATGQGRKITQATLAMNFQRGTFRPPSTIMKTRMKFTRGSINATLDTTGLNANLQLQVSRHDIINARIMLPGYTVTKPFTQNQAIQGVLNINSSNLKLLRQFIPDAIRLKGQLLANINLGGTIAHPRFNGQIKLQQGTAQIPQLKLTLTKITVDLDAVGTNIKYSAEAYSQNKLIQITGTTRLDTAGNPTHLKVQSNDVLIVNTSEYMIYATTALAIDIKGHDIHLSGTITIPRANLQPITFNNAITLPEDIVYVGPTVEKQQPWNISTDVKIILGDKVMVDTQGLTGRLTGQITVVKTPTHTYVVNGKIGIANGVFTTHGKTLTIETGSVITFTQSPLKNPNLSIRAVKKIRTVPHPGLQTTSFGTINVGVHIKGTLRHPSASLFSTPAGLSQADILSYLLFGHPSNANTPSNVSFLLAAIDTLDIGGGKTTPGGIADQIAQGLGLSEFGIESQTTLDAIGTPLSRQQTAFVVGRYISPRIYVRYSRGLVIPINIVQVRYLLGTNWAIQTDSSSLGNGIDVLYTIQKN